MTKHNWCVKYQDHSPVVCATTTGVNPGTYTWPRLGPIDCRGCGATIPELVGRNIRAPFGSNESYSTLDRLWHTEYRPMAEFVTLVEEADDSPA